MRTISKEDYETLKRAAEYHIDAERVALNGQGVEKIPVTRWASEVTPETVEWVWPGRLARGKIALLEGDPGLGKSCLTTEIAARLSRGQLLPDGTELPPIGTLILSAEDGVADTIVPRLIAAGADLTQIMLLEGVRLIDDAERGVTVPQDLDVLATLITTHGFGLVIVDPLSVFLGDDINENKNQEVRKALSPVKTMLEQTRAASLFLRHWTKAQSTTAVYRGAGSIGLGGAARIVMMVAQDPEDETMRVLAGVKENLSVKPPSLAYRVVSNHEKPDVAQIAWAGQSTWNAADLQAGPGSEEGEKLREAKAWLEDYLRGEKEGQAREIYKRARADGHAERTIDRAKKALGVVSHKSGMAGWVWVLSKDATKDATPWD